MDRSFLSQTNVIEASRDFVCIRLATYEDPSEADYLKSFHVTRSGDLENTVFAILSADGKLLSRAGRGAAQVFRDAATMASTMKKIASTTIVKDPEPTLALPLVANVRLAVNVAAADSLPLVVIYGSDKASLQALESRVASVAWSPEYRGRFIYASSTEANELNLLEGVKAQSGVYVIQPERFGRKGAVLSTSGAATTRGELVSCLNEALLKFSAPNKTFGTHVRQGHSEGIFWETRLPVTDPMEQQARERGRLRKQP